MAVDMNGAKIVAELKGIGKELHILVDLLKLQARGQTRTMPSTPIIQNVLASVQVVLDWTTDGINGVAQIVEENGVVKITVVVDQDQTERLVDMIPRLEMDSLQISAMAGPK